MIEIQLTQAQASITADTLHMIVSSKLRCMTEVASAFDAKRYEAIQAGLVEAVQSYDVICAMLPADVKRSFDEAVQENKPFFTDDYLIERLGK